MMIALVAVPAILIGLLTMHVLTIGSTTDAGVSAASASYHADEKAVSPAEGANIVVAALIPSVPAPAEDCAGSCMPNHDMLGMMCVLALLITVMLFTLHLILTSGQPLKRALSVLAANAASLAPQPSLHVLSISRT